MKLDDLPGHAGAVAVRLPDGSLTVTADRPAGAVGIRAQCSCGWCGPCDHPPNDTGHMSATSDWIAHMKPLWAAAPPAWLVARSEALRDSLAELAADWPLQALGVLAHVERWHQGVTAQAVAEARAAGRSWAEVGAALGITKQSAHERFRASEQKPARPGAAGSTDRHGSGR
ncbi:hypothetical protein AB0D32_21165 [Micromonospora sp. NPDC048170]|uniref:hypothetical protein n=1 Tax=Micromonospora sp. NPDC048170 TaxID=3154819 RepID=UPI0033F6FCF5